MGRMFEGALQAVPAMLALRDGQRGPRSVRDEDYALEAMRAVGPWLLAQADAKQPSDDDVHICAAITRLQFAALVATAEEQPKSELGHACAALIEQRIDDDETADDDDEDA